MARSLELDAAEEELRRPVARAGGVEAREPAGKVDEGDPHAGGGYRRLPSDPMHRQRTKLAKRVNRVASSVERRGIVATYELHDRLLGNRECHAAASTPTRRELDDVAASGSSRRSTVTAT